MPGGRIDERDAAVLYVSDAHGENLHPLTTNDVNVIGLSFYEKLGFRSLSKFNAILMETSRLNPKTKLSIFKR